MDIAPTTFDLLRLTLTPGLGPVLIPRLIEALGSPAEVLKSSPARLASVKGIGQTIAARAAEGLKHSEALAQQELALAEKLGATLIGITEPTYPEPLRTIPDPPPILYVRGQLRGQLASADQPLWGVAIVGSRRCSHYGIEQAERFAGVLASAGLTIVSGGARGIDTAAHRGTLRSRGRTIAVLGCGLAHCYPPENAELFEQIAATGAVVSELPLNSSPQSENFPARNRIISGMSLGVVVIEAGDRSGALITAKQAAEEHGREVMAIPGRIDSTHSAGSHALIKSGGASLVTDPGDVLEILRTPARHQALGTFASRYATETASPAPLFQQPASSPPPSTQTQAADPLAAPLATSIQQRILASLTEPRTIDQLATTTSLTLEALRAELTVLEIQRRVKRQGARLVRC